jgi:uncharacterized iron-regulated membrane protein
VAFNLNEVYKPVMKLVFDMREPMDDMSKLDKPLETPALSWREAYARGRELMNEAASRNGFTIINEQFLTLVRAEGTYIFMIRGSRDFGKGGGTMIAFDANTGALKSLSIPSEAATGQIISGWLVWLHMALVFGLPMQIFVCTMGFVITALSVTGVYIWWKKRRSETADSPRADMAVS